PRATPVPQATASAPAPTPRSNIRTLPRTGSGKVLTGTASWYGAELAGRLTACGQPFDPEQLTLASRELRCGTQVRVTAANGRSVEAVVTDWGPAEWTGRRFDLSQATFAAIHALGAGVIPVEVEIL
ncbi:MAG: septal ring lytic transglycosylase RlpA family protein, partial [Actinomycetota bacterium]|nr:septal ring lytic transglycosylase RlpA family protein [Actinomycetota bacterium]